HASANREKWLARFNKIGYDATRPRKDGELNGYAFRLSSHGELAAALKRGGVEVQLVNEFKYGENSINLAYVVDLVQPYSSFARAMMDEIEYPNLLDDNGKPVPPYDVTAHNLALLNGMTVIPLTNTIKESDYVRGALPRKSIVTLPACEDPLNAATLQTHTPSMDEGWTRWVLLNYGTYFARSCDSVIGKVTPEDLTPQTITSIVIPDQSPDQILNGYEKDEMPDEYVGGLGTEGVARLRKFVEEGGTLVFLNRSSDFAIEQFELPVENIAKDWEQRDFFIPGSILRTELDTGHPIAKDMKAESIAWFERSPVFEIKSNGGRPLFARVIAKYPDDPEKILLSGWALGKEKIAGKAALVEVKIGRGKIVLFGFRPQYRGQSLATFPLLFKAISY
ncbi:MAG: hypothetical protein OEQ28_14190, partial [Acidobacteriota bacterium]|nr:hypothetical protein [Acidobacteriota bacterium]